jgi:hypothetical protein
MFLGLEPFLGVLPRSMGGALDLGAQIRSILGFLLVVALLLWPERVAASGFTAPLSKFGAAGFFPLQIKAKLFLAGRGGGGKSLLRIFHFWPAVEARKSGSSGQLLLHRGGGAAAASVGGLVLCPAMVER